MTDDYSYKKKQIQLSDKINALEILTLLVSISLIITVSLWGFNISYTKEMDKQKNIDINNVLSAIISFYNNSSLFQPEKKYPISVCSGKLNEVDFEYTLRLHLTGKKESLDLHQYIKPEDYPKDAKGVYSTTVSTRKINLRSCPKIFDSKITKEIYPDSYPSCNFLSSNSKYRNCYLYTSSTVGNNFELAYYSRVSNSYIIYKGNNKGEITVSKQQI